MNRSGIILAGFLAAGLSGMPRTASAQEAVNAGSFSGLSPAPESAAAMPWCVFLSLRKTLNDIVYIDQILGNEVSQLLTDTNYLYGSWRSYGESRYSRGYNPGSKAGIVERAGYEEQYTGIWNLYSDVQALSAKMNAVSEEARNFEKEWWSVRAAMKKELKNGGTGEKSAPRLDKLRENLAGLSSRYGYINSQAPSLQSQYDYNRTGYLQFINSAAADDGTRSAVDIPEPWHWQYRNSQTPRAEMNYDFEGSYGKYFKMSHNELHTGLPASRGGSKRP